MTAPALQLRPAGPVDAEAIRSLARGQRLNPVDLDKWQNFIVAAVGERIVGAVQMRRHPDGARELGTLVVAPDARGHGIAAQMIDALLAAQAAGRVQMITGGAYAAHYSRWGFRPIEPREAPRSVRRNYRFGRMACMLSVIRRLPPKRLVILERDVGEAG